MPVLFGYFCLELKNLISEHQKYTKRSPKASKMEVCRPPKRELETEQIRESLKTTKLRFETDWVSVRERFRDGRHSSLGSGVPRAGHFARGSELKSTEPDLTSPMGQRPGELLLLTIINIRVARGELSGVSLPTDVYI